MNCNFLPFCWEYDVLQTSFPQVLMHFNVFEALMDKSPAAEGTASTRHVVLYSWWIKKGLRIWGTSPSKSKEVLRVEELGVLFTFTFPFKLTSCVNLLTPANTKINNGFFCFLNKNTQIHQMTLQMSNKQFGISDPVGICQLMTMHWSLKQSISAWFYIGSINAFIDI